MNKVLEIESIVKAVQDKIITRKTGSILIQNVLRSIPPHPSTEEGINS